MTNDFFGFDIKDILSESMTDFFSTDVKTILGKNIVKNFVCKINFEIKTLGYSDSANDIAEFYEECKKNGGIIKFVTNPVIKMILILLQEYPDVKRYLNDRMFEDIYQERIHNLENTFKNNDEICEKNQEDEHSYKLNKELRRKKIIKIQKEKKCSFEQAEKILENIEKSKVQNNLANDLIQEMQSFLPTEISKKIVISDDKDNFKKKNIEKSENKEIDLNEDVCNNDFSDDNFWE